ncbi:hypothetical protein ASG81_22360 [Paenibacillus sp. Soil522]|nr:CARDB domain-containing protein [Paenibacillus sp. Soil522]KRE35026.1 hypothetical protein ASG81_22360 [Paenibacillus sp. Soil522]
MTKSVAKNWVKEPWRTVTGRAKGIEVTSLSNNSTVAAAWLTDMTDPYGHSKTFLESYNKLKGTNWTGDTLLDYAIIQQARTKFSPGVVQMWNIWEPDGSWWYEMFTIPAEPLPPPPSKPDLIISELIAPVDSWVGDSVPIKITTKNQGKANSGAFTVGIVGTSIKSEVISNVPPGQIKTVTVNVSSTSNGIKSFKAKTDFGEAVAESIENNNAKDFKITINKKNEPTTPIAIISHIEGDHRMEPEMTIQPAAEPKLDDKLSYSPGKESITIREWKYKTPTGMTIAKKPAAKDFTAEGEYLVELRVTNSANKVSEWAQLHINVAMMATPNPSASPTPTPKPDLKADVEFIPPSIIAGETSSLINRSDGFNTYTWKFSNNLNAVLPNHTDFEYFDKTYTEPGYYTAEITVTDDSGGSKRDTAVLQVIDPIPVAVVAGVTSVIQGRDFLYPHHLLNSYTPLSDRGVTIDFTKSEMRHKKREDFSYTNGWPNKTLMDLGEYVLEGKVYDSNGRVSDWGSLIIEVVPDMPPAVNVVAPEEIYRSNDFMLYIDAESLDGNQLDHLFIEERYDQDDDGNFDEDLWTTLYDGAFKWTHPLKYSTVGKRQYRVSVTEDFGKQGISPLVQTDVLNYAPEANFNVFGITQQPGKDEDSGPPITAYTPVSIFRSWTLKNPYTGGNGDKVSWKINITNSSIATKNGIMANFKVGYPNSGNGANSRTKYQLAADITGKPSWVPSGVVIEQVFAGNRIYTYNTIDGKYVINEVNAETGEIIISRPFDLLMTKYSFIGMGSDESFYFYDYDASVVGGNFVSIVAYTKEGRFKDRYEFSHDIDTKYLITTPYVKHFEISPDGRYMYIGLRQAWNYVSYYQDYETALRFYKYDLKNKQLIWESSGKREYKMNYFDIKMTHAQNGDVFITYKKQMVGTSNYSLFTFDINKVAANGVSTVTTLGSGGILTYAALSDDETYVYVITYSLDWNLKRVDPIFTTLTAVNLQVIRNIAIMATIDDWGIDSFDYGGANNPVVLPDGDVRVYDRTANYYSYLFDKNGSQKARYEGGVGAGNADKIFLNANGDTIYPSIYSTYIGQGQASSAFLLNRTKGYSIAYSSEASGGSGSGDGGGVPGGQVGSAGNGYATSTPILPNGSIFLFEQSWNSKKAIFPFISASGNDGIKAIDGDTIEITNDEWGGLLYDAGSSMKNYALAFDASVNDANNAKVIGAGFHIQNEKNMYAVEWSKDTLTLFKVVNGVKTSLQSVALTRNAFTSYPIKVEVVNGTLRVFVNHSKKIEIEDSTYSKGAAGIMSLGQPSASFADVKKTNYGDTYIEETYETVLVDEPIYYEKLFKDIENDPMGAEEWSYSHNPNFFENPEGLSAYHGQTLGATVNALEKAGVYEISFRARDNTGLSAYNKWSEPVKKLLYVHRRPLAQPDVRFTGNVFAEGEALDYETFDTSYDPDIAHILSDKIFRTRWADESTWTAGKRAYYNRPGVELFVQEQVRDIHGAWSYWGQYIVYKDTILPINQTKPVMTIASPAGTTAAAPTVLAKEPTIRWTYFDAEDDPQEQYRLTVSYVDNDETALYIEHEGNALTYPMLEGSIVPGRVVKVQGQVYSAGVWSNVSNIRYFVLDLPPETFLLNFNGADADHPIYMNANRPQLRVFTVDPEIDPLAAIDYEVFRASTGENVVDTNSAIAAASYTTAALAEGLHYWRARANDSYLWGPYSRNGFFFVDTVKPDDVNERLVIEPTAVSVTFDAFSDTEPSSGHASRTFYLQRVNADSSVTNIDLDADGSSEYSIPLALDRKSYQVTGLIAGQEYRLTVLDYDAAGNEGHFAYIHFVTNRPPTADFDWTPKPVYEGDMTSFLSDAGDADGNPLSIAYELTSPTGSKSSYSYTADGPSYPASGPSLRLTAVGTWSMTMTVSDGIADPVSITKSLQVLPLQVIGYVKHTELWDKRRRDYNTAQTGQPDSSRYYSVFWAGEKFVLEADTTSTGTATKAERVEVKMTDYAAALHKTNDAQTSWSGEMRDNAFSQLKQGKIKFVFTAYFTNGTIKEAAVEISIDGNTLNTVGVHRVH